MCGGRVEMVRFWQRKRKCAWGKATGGVPETMSASSHQILSNSSIFRRARTYLEEINGHIIIAGKQLLLDEREALHSGSHGDRQTAEGQSTSGFARKLKPSPRRPTPDPLQFSCAKPNPSPNLNCKPLAIAHTFHLNTNGIADCAARTRSV